jgi:predicted FMN-binding regulatory protein PaiB
MTRIEGKWKLGQNMGEADRAGAASGIETTGGDLALAALMRGVAKK